MKNIAEEKRQRARQISRAASAFKLAEAAENVDFLRRKVARLEALGEDVCYSRNKNGGFDKPIYISSLRKLFEREEINARQLEIAEFYHICVNRIGATRGAAYVFISGSGGGSHEGWLARICDAGAFIDKCHLECSAHPVEMRMLQRVCGVGLSITAAVRETCPTAKPNGRAVARGIVSLKALLVRLERVFDRVRLG